MTASGRSANSPNRPCSKSTLRVGQLGSPVVVALRARSRRTSVGSALVVPTGPAQAARIRPSPPSRASPLRRDIVPPARDATDLTLTPSRLISVDDLDLAAGLLHDREAARFQVLLRRGRERPRHPEL